MCSGGANNNSRGEGKAIYKGLFTNVGLRGVCLKGYTKDEGQAKLQWAAGKEDRSHVDARLLVGVLAVGVIIGGDLVLERVKILFGVDVVRAALGTMLLVCARIDVAHEDDSGMDRVRVETKSRDQHINGSIYFLHQIEATIKTKFQP